jgi:hypothetical protein
LLLRSLLLDLVAVRVAVVGGKLPLLVLGLASIRPRSTTPLPLGVLGLLPVALFLIGGFAVFFVGAAMGLLLVGIPTSFTARGVPTMTTRAG